MAEATKKSKRIRDKEAKAPAREARAVPGPKPNFKRIKITDPIDARVEMINGNYALTPKLTDAEGKTTKSGTLDTMSEIRAVLSEAARDVRNIIQAAEHDGQPKADTGRVIAGLDALQAAKNIFCDALILPHAHKDIPAAVEE
jgi:hypothetical protein